jgi:hypothetical protein
VERDPMLFEPSLLLFPRDVNRIGVSMASSVQRQQDADIDKNGFRSLFSIQIGKSIYKANQWALLPVNPDATSDAQRMV